MPPFPIVLAHGIARFDFLTEKVENKLGLPESVLSDQLEYFKGIKSHLEAHGFTVSHPNQSFSGSVDLRAQQLRDRVNTGRSSRTSACGDSSPTPNGDLKVAVRRSALVPHREGGRGLG